MQTNPYEPRASVRALLFASLVALSSSCAPTVFLEPSYRFTTTFRWPTDDPSMQRTVASDTPGLGDFGFDGADDWNRYAFGALGRLCADRAARLTPSAAPLARMQWDALCAGVPSSSFSQPCIVRTAQREPAPSRAPVAALEAASPLVTAPRACVAPPSALTLDVVAVTGAVVSWRPGAPIGLGDLAAGSTRRIDVEVRNPTSNGGAVSVSVRADEGGAAGRMIASATPTTTPCGASIASGASCHLAFDVTPVDDVRRPLGLELSVATRTSRRPLPVVPIVASVSFGPASPSFTVTDAGGRTVASRVVAIPPGDVLPGWGSQPGLLGICVPVGGSVQAFLTATSGSDAYSLGASAVSSPGWVVSGDPARVVPAGALFVVGGAVTRSAMPVRVAVARATAASAGRLLVNDILRGAWGPTVGSYTGRARADFVLLPDTDRLCRP